MKSSAKTRARKPRDLLSNRLEKISKDVFKQYFSLITQLVSDSPGIYALYDGDELYYVGKSTELRMRVRHHLRDRHLASWTHFSLYLVRREEHIHEMESLLVRIANPKGNRVVPHGKSRGALVKALKRLIKQRQKEELSALLGSKPKKTKWRTGKHGNHPDSLVGLVSKRATLFRQYKGRDYTAKLSPKGTIAFKGKKYTSPTGAARAVIGANRAVSGWVFWYIKDTEGNWIRLEDYKE
jgi:hypothetical protein